MIAVWKPCFAGRGFWLHAVAAVLACLAGTAGAAEPAVTVSGFGTLGAVYHDAAGVGFQRDVSQSESAPAGRVSLTPDSMLGIQFDAALGKTLQCTVQLVSRTSLGHGYAPQPTWAYLKYKPSQDSDIRVGRLGLEFYLQGDSAEIGYGNLQVRPQLVYIPRSFNGVDAETVYPVAGGTLRLKLQAGYATGVLPGGSTTYDISGSRGVLAIADYQSGAWTARVSAGHLRFHNQYSGSEWQTLEAVLPSLPNGTAIRNAVSMKGRNVDIASLALAYDKGPLQAMGSFAVFDSPGWPNQYQFYANAGYRVGRFTPYVGYSWQRASTDTPATGIPDGYSPLTDQVNFAAGQAMGATRTNQTDWSAGVRYELARNLDLKAQVDYLRYRDPASLVDPSLYAVSYSTRPWKSMTLYSLALDFVF